MTAAAFIAPAMLLIFAVWLVRVWDPERKRREMTRDPAAGIDPAGVAEIAAAHEVIAREFRARRPEGTQR